VVVHVGGARVSAMAMATALASNLSPVATCQTDLIFEAVDTNGDGMVDADEFLNAFSIKGVDGDYFGDRRSLHTN